MSAKSMNVFDAYIVTGKKSMNAFEFADFVKKERDEIKSVRFVPPIIGSEGFGLFEVEVNTTSFEVEFDR